jgi:hypothetical protein
MIGCDQDAMTGIDRGSDLVGTVHLAGNDAVPIAHQSGDQQTSQQARQDVAAVRRNKLVRLSDDDVLHILSDPLRLRFQRLIYTAYRIEYSSKN